MEAVAEILAGGAGQPAPKPQTKPNPHTPVNPDDPSKKTGPTPKKLPPDEPRTDEVNNVCYLGRLKLYGKRALVA